MPRSAAKRKTNKQTHLLPPDEGIFVKLKHWLSLPYLRPPEACLKSPLLGMAFGAPPGPAPFSSCPLSPSCLIGIPEHAGLGCLTLSHFGRGCFLSSWLTSLCSFKTHSEIISSDDFPGGSPLARKAGIRDPKATHQPPSGAHGVGAQGCSTGPGQCCCLSLPLHT